MKVTFVAFVCVLLVAPGSARADSPLVDLTGRVSDEGGKPLTGVMVLVASGDTVRRAVTGADGLFAVTELQSSVRYEVEVRTLERLSKTAFVELPATGGRLDVVVERGATAARKDDPGMTFFQQTRSNTNIGGGLVNFGPVKVPFGGIGYQRVTTTYSQTPGGSVLIPANTYQTRP